MHKHSGTDTHDLYDRPYAGQLPEEQWPLLAGHIEERNPRRIGINTGSIQWAAGGLTKNLYDQLLHALPSRFVGRLENAESLSGKWLSTLSEREIGLYDHVVEVARNILGDTLSPQTIEPGSTTTEDLVWHYWQTCADLGVDVSFKPSFRLLRSPANRVGRDANDSIIRRGDLVHSDVGIRYMRLNTDHQEWAYVRLPGEDKAPDEIKSLMQEGNRLQDIFLKTFRHGMTGNELLSSILNRARTAGISNPRVYSHSLGLLLHEPGPLIGLPWEQERCIGRGDVRLDYDMAFAMELSVARNLDIWDGEELCLSIEQDVVFSRTGCHVISGRQREFHLI